jgi:hypothetical protein
VLRWGSCHSPALSCSRSLAAALTQAALAVVKGRAQAIPPLAIVAGTQLVAFTTWFLYFVFTHETFTPPSAVAGRSGLGGAGVRHGEPARPRQRPR